MRCDKVVFLCQDGEEVYDEITGDYVSKEPVKYKKFANVSDMGDEKMSFLLGTVSSVALTIRLNSSVYHEVDYIEYEGDRYNIKQRKNLGNKTSFQVVMSK